MTTADTSANQFDPSLAEPKGFSLRRWFCAVCGRDRAAVAFLTFVVLTGLTPIEPKRDVVVFLPAHQCADHSTPVGIIVRESGK